MSLQALKRFVHTEQVDENMSDCTENEMESTKENRIVTLHLPQSSTSSLCVRENRCRDKSSPKRLSSDHALQAAKRMREQDNALSSKIIQNLQSDKAAFAAKLEETQISLQTSKQHCGTLQQTVQQLTSDNESLQRVNRSLEDQVEDLREVSAAQAEAVAQLEAELKQERAKAAAAAMDPADVELLALAKRYLKQNSQLQRVRSNQLRPAQKSNWQSDLSVAYCNSCSKNFGTFFRRHHCRGCGKVFCSSCCQDSLHLLNDPNGDSVLAVIDDLTQLAASDEYKGRQRTCKSCFRQAGDLQNRKQLLHDQSKAELRAMEEWLTRSGADFSAFLDDAM